MRPAWLLVSNALFFAGYLPFFVHGELLKVKPFRLSGATGSPNHFKKKTSSDNDEATNPFVDDDDWGNPSPPEQVGPPQSLPPSNDDGDNWGNPTLPKQVDPQQFFAYTPENYNDTKVIDFLALWSTEIRSAYMAQQPPVPLATFYARDLLSWDSMICGVDECGCLNAPSLDYIRSKYPDHPSRAREIYFGVIAWDAYFKLPCVLRRAMEIAVQGMQDLCDELARTFFHPSEKMGGGWCIFGEVFGSIFALLLISSVVVLWPYLMGIGAEISEFAAQTLHEIAEWILPALAKNPSIDVLRSVFSWESFLWKYQYIDEVRQLAMNGPNIYSGLARASQTIWKIIMRIGEESPRVAAPLKTLWTRVIEYLENSYSQKYLEYLYGPDIWRSPVWIPRYPGPPRKRHEHDERSPDTELKGTPYVSVSDIQDQDVLRKFCPLCVRSPLSRSSQLNPEFESAGIENAVAFTERSHKLGSINVTRWHDVAGAAPHPIQLRYFSGQHMGYTINIGANSRIRKREELELSPEDEKQLLEAFVTIADALSREHRVGVLNVLTAYNFINPPTKEDFRGDPSIHKRRDSQDKGSSKIHKRAPEDFDQSPFEFSYPTKLAGHPIFHSRFKKNACGHTKYRPNYEANTKACREEVTEIGDEFLRHMKETVEVVNSPIHLKSSMDWPEGQPAPFVRSYKAGFPGFPQLNVLRAWEHNVDPLAENILKQMKAMMVSKAWRDQQCYVHCGGANYDGFFQAGNGHPDWQAANNGHSCREACWVSKDGMHEPLYGAYDAAQPPWGFNMTAVVPYSWGIYQFTPFNGIVPGGFTIDDYDNNDSSNIHHVPVLPVCDSPYSDVADAANPGGYKHHEQHGTSYPCFCGDVFGDRSQAFWDAGYFMGSEDQPKFEAQFRRCRNDLQRLLQERPAAYLKVHCELYYNNLYKAVAPKHDNHHFGENKYMCDQVMAKWKQSYLQTMGSYNDTVDQNIMQIWRNTHKGHHDGHKDHQTMQHVNNDLKRRGCMNYC